MTSQPTCSHSSCTRIKEHIIHTSCRRKKVCPEETLRWAQLYPKYYMINTRWYYYIDKIQVGIKYMTIQNWLDIWVKWYRSVHARTSTHTWCKQVCYTLIISNIISGTSLSPINAHMMSYYYYYYCNCVDLVRNNYDHCVQRWLSTTVVVIIVPYRFIYYI